MSYPLFSVIVCAWSTTRKLSERPASVRLAQAHPNKRSSERVWFSAPPKGSGLMPRESPNLAIIDWRLIASQKVSIGGIAT